MHFFRVWLARRNIFVTSHDHSTDSHACSDSQSLPRPTNVARYKITQQSSNLYIVSTSIYSHLDVLTHGISSGNRNVFTNTPNADTITCIITYEYTARCVHIELFRYFKNIYSATWRIYSSPCLIRPPSHRPPGFYGHIFIAIAFSNTNYLSPAATRLMWPMVRIGWSIFLSSANR